MGSIAFRSSTKTFVLADASPTRRLLRPLVTRCTLKPPTIRFCDPEYFNCFPGNSRPEVLERGEKQAIKEETTTHSS